jgi:hypothetical protein
MSGLGDLYRQRVNPTPMQGLPPNPYQQNGPFPGSLGFGMDPNPAFTAAINRLAAALEKLSEQR